MKKTDNKPFALSISALFFLFLFSTYSLGGEFYKWVDAEGTVHVTDNISSIPPQYRDQVQKRTLQATEEPEAKPEPQKSVAVKNVVPPGTSLSRFEVPYRPFEGTARRIIVPVTLNNSVPARLLLDTGSPGLVISPELADRLGLFDRQDGTLLTTAGGIGGTVPAILSIVDTVKVGDAQAEFLPATITLIDSDDYEGLVGMDFLANYRIAIDTTKNVLVFDELPPKPEKPGGHDEVWWHHHFQRFARARAEWVGYLEDVEKANLSSSETQKYSRFAKSQCEEADKLLRKLEIYARDNAVPINWRR
jgi:hypothetical protein